LPRPIRIIKLNIGIPTIASIQQAEIPTIMASYITQKALALLAAEEQQKRMEEQQRALAAAAEAAAKAEAERDERIRLQAERELARMAAERLVAEKAAAEAQAAEALALQAELARLRNRGETEILRDEMAQMRAEIAQLKARPTALLTPQDLHLRNDGELDMRFKSSKEELATARSEIAELKALVRGLCVMAGQAEQRIACPMTNFNSAFLQSLTQASRQIYYDAQETARKMGQ